MAMSRNPNAYLDVRQVFDAALRAGGGKYTLSSPGRAQHWMQRAYTFRKILFDLEQERFGNVPGYVAQTAYDNIVLRREGATVYVALRRGLEGTLTDNDGNPIESVAEGGKEMSEEEMEVARRVARDLDLDIEE